MFRYFLAAFFVVLNTSNAYPFFPEASEEISDLQAEAISRALTELNQYKQNHQKAGLQNPDLAYAMKKAIVLADLLFTADGKINWPLKGLVERCFIPEHPCGYEAKMQRFLDRLDPSWQPFFDRVLRPASDNLTSTLALKALFGLAPSEQVADRHAKLAVLASMLAPYNQGSVGDCFAVADLIRDHEEFYAHAAQDCADIVQHGYAIRAVDQHVDYFFFLPRLADNDRSRPMVFDASGKLANAGISWIEAPGFNAVIKALGGDSIPDFSESVLHTLFHGTVSKQLSVTPAQVIHACALTAANRMGANADELELLGNYTFSSLTNNPILRGLESAFAAMAEDRARDALRENINGCVAQALKNVWSALEVPSAEIIQDAFLNQFNNSYRLIYNLDIPLQGTAPDGSSTAGGFQLYARDPANLSVMGTRVDTPEAFGRLAAQAISVVAEQYSGEEEIAGTLIQYVQTNDFLNQALWAYDEKNRKDPNPVLHYQQLVRTPMQSCDGDNPYEVDDIDTGSIFETNVQTFVPENSKKLIQWCLELAKRTSAELVPMNSPQHAFNFAPANPDLVAFVRAGLNSEQWIRQTLSIPGIQVARRPIDAKTKTTLAEGIWQLIHRFAQDSSRYRQLVEQLDRQPLNVQQYAQSFLEGICSLLGIDPFQSNAFSSAFDALLLRALPESYLSILEQSAIRFAATNWNDGIKDIYFCAYFNPRTERVSFGRVDEDKTQLFPMDESAWVNHKTWDVDLRPASPALPQGMPHGALHSFQ